VELQHYQEREASDKEAAETRLSDSLAAQELRLTGLHTEMETKLTQKLEHVKSAAQEALAQLEEESKTELREAGEAAATGAVEAAASYRALEDRFVEAQHRFESLLAAKTAEALTMERDFTAQMHTTTQEAEAKFTTLARVRSPPLRSSSSLFPERYGVADYLLARRKPASTPPPRRHG
jgi:hypothetical protein